MENYVLISLNRKPKKDFEKRILPSMGEDFYKIHNTSYILITRKSLKNIRVRMILYYPEMEEFVLYKITKENKDDLLTTTISTNDGIRNFKEKYLEYLEDTEENLNFILDKMNKNGYENLSSIEKDFLDKKSQT